MMDEYGYRPNVGIILCNQDGKVFWARRCGRDGWQFPQGGVRSEETVEQALFRELREEIGLTPAHVELLGRTHDWLHYDIPSKYRRRAVSTSVAGGRLRRPASRDTRTSLCIAGARRSDQRASTSAFKGQKQIWFLLRLIGREEDVRLDLCDRPEFDAWRWIDYWSALDHIITFKRDVYRLALSELEPLLSGKGAGASLNDQG
ncbi:MAG: RNA pyrophosphohydrolase [Gammaproteobacteria bacterium]|nr:MAG: RNA pyrophosphohydrolase [Gammaproteobacteria bacterium]